LDDAKARAIGRRLGSETLDHEVESIVNAPD
jgi:hypothetical protein